MQKEIMNNDNTQEVNNERTRDLVSMCFLPSNEDSVYDRRRIRKV